MLRLGVIGHGRRISGFIKNCIRGVDPDARVVGIVDPDPEGATSRLAECDQQDVVFYDSLDEMIRSAKLDALAIGTRCNLHTPYAIQAAKYDLPLFLEKPVSISMEQALSLEEAFTDTRCVPVVSFPLRVTPLAIMTRRKIAEGAVGTPQHILGTNYVPYGTTYWERGYRNYEITNGLFLQKATHDFDYMMYLMDQPIVRVAAMHSRNRIFGGDKPAGLFCDDCDEAKTCLESPENRKRNGAGGKTTNHECVFGVDCGNDETGINEDCSSALMQFASGIHGAYTQVFFSRRDSATRGATVSGYKGTIGFDWYKNEIKHVRHHEPFTDTIRAGAGASHFGGDIELGRDFVELVREGKTPRAGILEGMRSVYACLAAKKSAETGQFEDVRQVGQIG